MTVETFVTPKVSAKLELLFKEELYGQAHRLDCGTYKSDLSSITKCGKIDMIVETFVTPKVSAKLELLSNKELYGKAHSGTSKSDISMRTKGDNDCRDFCHTKSCS